MLARPEPGTRAHVLLWLAGKDPTERFRWHSPLDCACGQYSREVFGDAWHWTTLTTYYGSVFSAMNRVAQNCRTFGALHQALLEEWHQGLQPVAALHTARDRL